MKVSSGNVSLNLVESLANTVNLTIFSDLVSSVSLLQQQLLQEQSASALSTLLASERSARVSDVTGLTSAVAALTSSLTAEQSARAVADTQLSALLTLEQNLRAETTRR